jgi:hypothetical protein
MPGYFIIPITSAGIDKTGLARRTAKNIQSFLLRTTTRIRIAAISVLTATQTSGIAAVRITGAHDYFFRADGTVRTGYQRPTIESTTRTADKPGSVGGGGITTATVGKMLITDDRHPFIASAKTRAFGVRNAFCRKSVQPFFV